VYLLEGGEHNDHQVFECILKKFSALQDIKMSAGNKSDTKGRMAVNVL
jgi:hypothetical protein